MPSKDTEQQPKGQRIEFKRAEKKGVPLLSKADQDTILAEAERTNNYSATAKKYKMRVENLYRWKKARQKVSGKTASPAQKYDVAAIRPTGPVSHHEVDKLRQEVEDLRSALISATLEKERLLRGR